MNVGIKGFPDSLAYEHYRGVEIHVVVGPFSHNGYVVAPFPTIGPVEHDASVPYSPSADYDQVTTGAPGGWTFFERISAERSVLGFDHAHTWDEGNEYLPVEEVMQELRDCVDELIAAGYIEEEVEA